MNIRFALNLIVLVLATSSCSLSPVDRNPLLQIDLSSLAREDSRAELSIFSRNGHSTGAEFLLPPMSVSGFSCFGVNVTGPGISDSSMNPTPNLQIRFDAAVAQGKSCIYKGVTTPPLTAASGEVAMAVPPGPIRLVQVFGVNDLQLCQNGFSNGVGTSAGTSTTDGKVFEIARGVMQDFFGDRSLNVTVNWPSTANDDAARDARRMDCVEVPPAAPVISASIVAAGGSHTCIISSGSVFCSGANAAGQLGNGTTAGSNTFIPVPGISGVTAVAAGADYNCAVTSSGALYCWGGNASGQLGDGTTNNLLTPTLILASGVTSVAVGLNHTCAIVSGALKCWGANNNGQLGDATTTNHPTPTSVTNLTSLVTSVGVGLRHTCAVKNGSAYCWGVNLNGMFGNGTTSSTVISTPTIVSGWTTPTEIFTGLTHTCATISGALKCSGGNTYGQIGDGSVTDTAIPVNSVASGVTGASVGASHTCALVSNLLKCWGRNNLGQVGNASVTDVNTPTTIIASGVTQVSTGASHTCAIVSGIVECWGYNTYGQLGDGTFTSRTSPP